MMRVRLSFFCTLYAFQMIGQVGIGTSTPSAALDVESDEVVTSVFIDNTAVLGDPVLQFQINSVVTWTLGVDDSDDNKFKIGTTAIETGTALTIDTLSKVGIGTSSPTAQLDCDGAVIFNESGASKDFRIESDNNSSMFFVDGSEDAVGINTNTPVSGLDVSGSLGLKVTTLSATTTLDQTHNVVLCSNSSDITLTLPAAASNTGKVYYIKKVGANTDLVVIDGEGAETIDDATTFTLYAYSDAIRIVSDGAAWHIINKEIVTHKTHIYNGSAQAVADATFTAGELPDVEFDDGGLEDTGNDRVAIVRDGKYVVIAGYTAGSLDDGEKANLYLNVNGSIADYAVEYAGNASNQWVSVRITRLLDLSAGDVLSITIRHDEGASVNTLTGASSRPFISVKEIK